MSLPQTVPLSVYRGDTWRRALLAWADAAKTQPYDLTGVAVAAEIRDVSGGTVLAVLACTVTGARVDLVLSATDSRTLPVVAQWDVQFTYPSGDVQTVVRGDVTVTGDITGSTMTLLQTATM